MEANLSVIALRMLFERYEAKLIALAETFDD